MGRKNREGRRIKSLDPFSGMIPFIMPRRTGAMNSFSTYVEIGPAEALVKKLRAEGYNSIGLMHVIIAAYVRAVSQRPKVNRYIRGQRVYARNGIVVNLTVKKKMSLDAEETAMKMHFDPSDTLFDVYRKFTAEYEKIVGIGAEENGTDRFARIVMGAPRFLVNGCVWFLKLLDYYDLIPMSLLEISPFHGSMFITNMASLNIPPVTHHLYDFGNVPIFIAFGQKRSELIANEDGTVAKSRVMDVIANLDERICDGFYYASAIKLMKKYFQHPEDLTVPPETVIQDDP